jgi:hypothetical protein
MTRVRFILTMVVALALYVLMVLWITSAEAQVTPGATNPMPYLYPPTRTDTSTVLYEMVKSKPALNTAFVDSTFSTQFMRISSDTTLLDDAGRVPIYSQLQAWNADQTKLILSDGTILNSPSYSYYRRELLPGNFRWSPIYPDTAYYSDNSQAIPRFMIYNVRTAASTVAKSFPEYRKLEISKEWEDLDESGRFVVLMGYRHGTPSGHFPCSAGDCNAGTYDNDTIQVRAGLIAGVNNWLPTDGNGQTDSLEVGAAVFGPGLPANTRIIAIDRATKRVTMSQVPSISTPLATVTVTTSEAFMLNVVTGWKSRAVPTYGMTGCTGIADMLVSPRGDYMLLHWGSGGTDTLQCGVVAYDTTGTYAGTVVGSSGHYDVTIDKDGSQWWVGGIINAYYGPQSGAIAKARIPNGYNQWRANPATGIFQLMPYPANDCHVSARGFRSGFAIVSSDDPNGDAENNRKVFSNEITKVYLDSRRKGTGQLHIERLADTRSSEWEVGSPNPCSLRKYWAQPHATVSRDGTRVIWGSSWHSGTNCTAETFVMNISREGANPTFVNQTPNTWRRLAPPRVINADGTGGGAADTNAPYMTFTDWVFAPEYGGGFYWGGGGHSGRRGNDVWFFNTADTTMTQMTVPDSVNLNQYPTNGTVGTPSIRSLLSLGMTGGCNECGGAAPVCADACITLGVAGGPERPWSLYYRPTYQTMSRPLAPGYSRFANPWGRTANGHPQSSHQYDQMAWDSYRRKFKIFGINFITGGSINSDSVTAGASDDWYATRAKGVWVFDPYSKQWPLPAAQDTFPDIDAKEGGGEWDPINMKLVTTGGERFHTAGSVSLFDKPAWVQDVAGAWSHVASPPGDPYGARLNWDRWNQKVISYPRNGNAYYPQEYNAATATWDTLTALPDAGSGLFPPYTDSFSAYSVRDTSLVIWGSTHNWGDGSLMPTWKYSLATHRWKKMNPAGEPANTLGVSGVQPIVYDTINHVILMLRHRGGSNIASGIGDVAATQAENVEVWIYKPSAGDGRIFDPTTPAAPGGGGSCLTPGF